MLVFVHIPKTAGTTFGTILHHHYRGEAFHYLGNAFSRFEEIEVPSDDGKVRAASGHITFGLQDRLPATARYVTILRDPVERTLSHYYYLAGGRGGGFIPPWLAAPSAELTLEECLEERGYIPDNLQTRMLCGLVSPYGALPTDALEQAKRNLRERFAYVGTTERFEEFLALVNLELGWPTVAFERTRANPDRPSAAEAPAELVRLAERRNGFDRELHAYAGELLAQALDRAGPELGLEVEIIRAAAARDDARPPAAVRSLPVEARVELAIKERELARMYAELRHQLRKRELILGKRRERKRKRAAERDSGEAPLGERLRRRLARLARGAG